MKKPPPSDSASRRRFLGTAVGALVLPSPTAQSSALQPATAEVELPKAARPPLDIPTLEIAQKVAAVEQSHEALGKALPMAGRYRDHIETLRTVEVATDVEPAFSFNPRRRPRAERPTRGPRPTSPPPAGKIPGPGSKADIAYADISRLRAWLTSGEVTSEQIARLSIERLKQHDPTLSCVVTLTDQRSLEEARQADGERRQGSAAAIGLHGIPYGAKDLFDSAGIRTLWGARPYLGRAVPKSDSTALARLRKAGACLTAKLSTGELAVGDSWAGEARFQDGRPLREANGGASGHQTKNPWDPATGSSGSSAGPAAAVAAGLLPFALGTETGGSIISPATACGVVGLRPTYGRVSRAGVMTLRWTMDKVGVIARSVADCGTVLQAIHGPDGRDGTVSDAPFPWNEAASRPARRLRMGIVESELFEPGANATEKERARFALVRPVFEAAVEVYRRAGFEIVPLTLPPFPADALYAIHNAEAGAMFDEITRSGAIDDLEGQGPTSRSSQLRASRFIPAVDYIRAQRIRTLMIASMEEIFDRIDVFLAPPSSDSVNLTNLTGHPALVVPAGFVKSESGSEMPRSIMLTGRLDDEATLLDAGLVFERDTPWHSRRPPLYS